MLHLKGSHVAGDYPTPGGFETRLYGDVDYGWGAGRRPPSWGQAFLRIPALAMSAGEEIGSPAVGVKRCIR